MSLCRWLVMLAEAELKSEKKPLALDRMTLAEPYIQITIRMTPALHAAIRKRAHTEPNQKYQVNEWWNQLVEKEITRTNRAAVPLGYTPLDWLTSPKRGR